MIYVYTDGACRIHTDRRGGLAYVVLDGTTSEKIAEGGKTIYETTNNRMEVQAAIEALYYLQSTGRTPSSIILYSDSLYLVDAFKKKWVERWEKHNYKGRPNSDLWREILNITRTFKDLTFEHVKGHNGDTWNEYVDKLALRYSNGS